MHYLRLVDFFSINYRNLYGHFPHSAWGTTKGKLVTRLGVNAAFILGWFACLNITPAYGLVWSLQDSYKIDNNSLDIDGFGGGIDGFLMGSSAKNLVYTGFQTQASKLNNNAQAGVGAGYRRLIGANHTLGAYLFWDGLFDYTDQDIASSNFNLGLEGNLYFLNFRINGYAPFSRMTRDQHDWVTENRGNDIIQKGNVYLGEMIQHGWDGQIGISAFKDKVRLFGGTYYFDGDMAKPIHGIVGGASIDITSRIRVHGQYTQDSLNKPMVTVGAQFNRAASPALQTTPLYRLWRPAERTLLPASAQVKGRWYVKETGHYFFDVRQKKPEQALKKNIKNWATVENKAYHFNQKALDEIAALSPSGAKIFLNRGAYYVDTPLQLHPGQNLIGCKEEGKKPQMRLENLCLADNTVVENLRIHDTEIDKAPNIIRIRDINKLSLIDNEIQSQKFLIKQTNWLGQADLDKIATLSPNGAKIFLDCGTYYVDGSLQLHLGQNLIGHKEGDNKPELTLKKLCLADNTVVENLCISSIQTDQVSNIVEMLDINNFSLIDNDIQLKQFFIKNVTGMHIKNAKGYIVENNKISLENQACFSKLVLTGITAQGGHGLLNNNKIDLNTFSKSDQLLPMDIKELSQPIPYNKIINSVKMFAPLLNDYLDELTTEESKMKAICDIVPEEETLCERQKGFIDKVDARYVRCHVEHLKRTGIAKIRLFALNDNYSFIPEVVIKSDIEELGIIKNKLEVFIPCLEVQLNKKFKAAYDALYKDMLSIGTIHSEEMSLEEFQQKSAEDIIQLHKIYLDGVKFRRRESPNSHVDETLKNNKTWETVKASFPHRDLLNDMQSQLAYLKQYAAKYKMSEFL